MSKDMLYQQQQGNFLQLMFYCQKLKLVTSLVNQNNLLDHSKSELLRVLHVAPLCYREYLTS